MSILCHKWYSKLKILLYLQKNFKTVQFYNLFYFLNYEILSFILNSSDYKIGFLLSLQEPNSLKLKKNQADLVIFNLFEKNGKRKPNHSYIRF